MSLFYLIIFIISFFALAFSSKRLVVSLTKIARVLGWKEFVVAFFTMALAASISNFSVGISSALHKIPQLSLSDIIGGNIIDLTLVVALAVLISKNGLRSAGRTVQGSAVFVLLIAIFPLILMLDGMISRIDGMVLIVAFFIYVFWLFSKKERFHKTYNNYRKLKPKDVFKHTMILCGSLLLLLLAAEGIVRSVIYFSLIFSLPLALIGILIIGLGNALPELFFTIQAAKKGKGWIVIGNLMGSIIFPATLVLGTVALIHPIEITNFSPFAIGRFFLMVSAIFFLIFLRTGKRITKREAILLLIIYLVFVAVEILFY